jgi:type II secretory pathway pseudopilin PulG
MEIMVVVLIIGTALLLVPANIGGFGARSRLENTANTLASAVNLAREQAILDGRAVALELGVVKTSGGKVIHGHRFAFSNQRREQSDLLDPEGEREPEEDPEEEETLFTEWHENEDGVEFKGVSLSGNQWEELRQDRPFVVSFHPDGSVDTWFAVRVEAVGLEKVGREERTITLVVNGLTTQASVYDGYAEVPEQLDEHEFPR